MVPALPILLLETFRKGVLSNLNLKSMSHFRIIVTHRCHDIITDGSPDLDKTTYLSATILTVPIQGCGRNRIRNVMSAYGFLKFFRISLGDTPYTRLKVFEKRY